MSSKKQWKQKKSGENTNKKQLETIKSPKMPILDQDSNFFKKKKKKVSGRENLEDKSRNLKSFKKDSQDLNQSGELDDPTDWINKISSNKLKNGLSNNDQIFSKKKLLGWDGKIHKSFLMNKYRTKTPQEKT